MTQEDFFQTIHTRIKYIHTFHFTRPETCVFGEFYDVVQFSISYSKNTQCALCSFVKPGFTRVKCYQIAVT